MQESYSNRGPNHSKHEILLCHEVNLAKHQPGKEGESPFMENLTKNRSETPRRLAERINENWQLPLFSSEKGEALMQQILEWAKPEKGR